jgi:hypothetical protein
MGAGVFDGRQEAAVAWWDRMEGQITGTMRFQQLVDQVGPAGARGFIDQ